MTVTSETSAADAAGLAGLRRALVIGLGASGRAAADLLASNGVEVTIAEQRDDHPGGDDARAAGHEVVLGDPVPRPGDYDLVVPSPGVPESSPVLVAAAEQGVPVASEPELAFRSRPIPVVGVTGTNGKTSVTELVTAMLTADGRDAIACGNIGMPMSEAVRAAGPETLLVVELSSFQLRFVERLRCSVAVLLNLADDHLDWHGDAEAYHRAKARIWRAQQPEDWAVANLDDPVAAEVRDRHAPARRADVTLRRAPSSPRRGRRDGRLVADLPGHTGEVLALDELPLAAPHHHANVAAAATLALLSGASVEAVAAAARAFHPGRHRLELVAEADGVRYVDDSKATNVHAAAASLGSAESIVWVAGGLAKGADLTRWSTTSAPCARPC
jgi:UDP-N-acetylmuramoylalanine--D-glutamate ligase